MINRQYIEFTVTIYSEFLYGKKDIITIYGEGKLF